VPLETFVPGEWTAYPKLLIYGASGAGKTRFASTAPKPLFADLEKGMASVQRQVGRWPVESLSDLGALIKYLETENDPTSPDGYQTVVIDSLNEVQRLLNEYVLAMDPDVGRRPFKGQQMNQGDWGFALNLLENQVVRRLKDLPIGVVLIAGTSGVVGAEGKIEPALYGKNTVSMVTRYSDIVGYIHTRPNETTPQITEHVMRFHMAHAVSKDRSDRLPEELVDPTWEKMTAFWVPKSQKPAEIVPAQKQTEKVSA
jgi:hypothetical protein